MPSFRCPSCGKAYIWHESIAGQDVSCTNCAQRMTVPTARTADPSVDTASDSLWQTSTRRTRTKDDDYVFAPVPPGQPPKKNVYVVLDASDAILVACFIAAATVLVGLGWWAVQRWNPPQPVAPAVAGEDPTAESVPVGPAAEPSGPARIELTRGSVQFLPDVQPGNKSHVLIDLRVEYTFERPDGSSALGPFSVRVQAADAAGDFPIDPLESPKGEFHLTLRLPDADPKDLASVQIVVVDSAGDELSGTLTLEPASGPASDADEPAADS